MHVNKHKQNGGPPVAVARVGIGIPFGGESILRRTMRSVIDLMIYSAGQRIAVTVLDEVGCYVQKNRWALAQTAIRENFTHLLYVDTDMGFRPDALVRLLAHKKPIVGTNYYTRTFPMSSTVKMPGTEGPTGETGALTMDEIPRDRLFECYAVGTGLMLVDVRVFRALPQPWFQVTHMPDGSLEYGEDVWFCRHARLHNFSVWCDPWREVEHWGLFDYKDHDRWEKDGVRYMDAALEAQQRPPLALPPEYSRALPMVPTP